MYNSSSLLFVVLSIIFFSSAPSPSMNSAIIGRVRSGIVASTNTIIFASCSSPSVVSRSCDSTPPDCEYSTPSFCSSSPRISPSWMPSSLRNQSFPHLFPFPPLPSVDSCHSQRLASSAAPCIVSGSPNQCGPILRKQESYTQEVANCSPSFSTCHLCIPDIPAIGVATIACVLGSSRAVVIQWCLADEPRA